MNSYLHEKKPAENGFALLSVLIILAILTPLVVNLSYSTRVQMSGSDYFASKIKSREIARAGLESAIRALKNDEKEYDSYLDEWGDFEELSSLSSNLFEDGFFTGKIEDEEGKININHLVMANAPDPQVENQLVRLMEEIEIDTDLLDAVIDWLDEDSETELLGAENNHYNGEENPYFSKNGKMDTIYEMGLIKGVTDDILFGRGEKKGLIPFISSFGDKKININTAPYEVLLAIADSLDPVLASRIIDYREAEIIKSADDLQKMEGMDSDTFASIRSRVKFSSEYFSVTISGFARETLTTLHAVLKRSGNNIKIVYYSET